LHIGPRFPKDRSDVCRSDRTAETAQVMGVDLARARVAINHGPTGVEGYRRKLVRCHRSRIAENVPPPTRFHHQDTSATK
jgi:hypothetical protein